MSVLLSYQTVTDMIL